MRILLKISPYILVFLIVMGAWGFAQYHEELDHWHELKYILYVGPVLISLLWLFAVSDFLNHELKEKPQENNVLIIALGLIYGVLILVTGYIEYFTQVSVPVLFDSKWGGLLIQVVSIPLVVLIIVKIRRYMYARSLWWLILEILIPVVGILTLTAALKEEKAELEIENKDSI